jgi:hypothetical protein
MLDKTPQKCGASRLLIKIYFLIGGDFLLPVNLGGHAAYQEFLLDQIPKYYPDPSFIPSDIRKAMERFWYKNLSLVDDLMKDRYSRLGVPSRLPSDMLCSMLLAAHFHVKSFTKWAAQQKLLLHYTLTLCSVKNAPSEFFTSSKYGAESTFASI